MAALTSPAAPPPPLARWILLVLVLFGLPFVVGGLGVLVLGVVPMVREWHAMQAWRPVQASVLAAHLEIRHGRKGSVAYRAHARYRYEAAGRERVGERVAVTTSLDSIGDHQQQLANRLIAAQAAGMSIHIWVDPHDPDAAIVDRSLRTGLLAFLLAFAVVFCGVGCGLWTLAWRGRRRM